jgi:hypothetical protein
MQVGAIELDGGGTSHPTRVGPPRHFSGLSNLQTRAEAELDTLFKRDGIVARCECCIRVEEKRGVQLKFLINVDPDHWRQVHFLEFSDAQQLDIFEPPSLC